MTTPSPTQAVGFENRRDRRRRNTASVVRVRTRKSWSTLCESVTTSGIGARTAIASSRARSSKSSLATAPALRRSTGHSAVSRASPIPGPGPNT